MSDELTRTELAALRSTLGSAGIAVRGRLEAAEVAGGRSNRTFRLTDGASTWILRAPPRRGRTPSAHDVAREYRVVSALHGSAIPVPDSTLYSTDESVIGSPFAVFGFVEGHTIRTHDELDQLGDSDVNAVARTLVATLAQLHSIDIASVGMESFGRPEGYIERQIARWTSQWAIVGVPDQTPHVEDISRRLSTWVPRTGKAAIVHGDFRIDNVILKAASGGSPEIAAVLDWELSSLGDPAADLALMCAYRHPALDLIHGCASAWTSPRLPAVPELIAMYVAAGGDIDSDFDLHLALAYFKIAVIAAGIAHRFRAGATTDPDFERAGLAVPEYLALAGEQLDRV